MRFPKSLCLFVLFSCALRLGVVADDTCSAIPSSSRQLCGFQGGSESSCLARGCCYDSSSSPQCFHHLASAPSAGVCSAQTQGSRLDCFPEATYSTFSEQLCAARGCCYDNSAQNGVPACYFPTRQGYRVTKNTPTATGFVLSLELIEQGPFGNDVQSPSVEVIYEADERVHFRIIDPAQNRYEVSQAADVLKTAPATKKASSPAYDVSYTEEPFGIAVTRVADGYVLFNSTPAASGPGFNGLVFENQFLEISTQIAPDASIYGLGEHIVNFKLPTTDTTGQTFTLFAKDQGTPAHNARGGTNLYGSHPFYVNIAGDGSGRAHGVFLLNSNALNIVLQPKVITYRAVGGVLDFFVFTGNTPMSVVQQYTSLVGRSFLPPYWGLGFHLCRWGYNSIANTKAVVEAMRDAGIPQDAQWNDIDYMQDNRDFTTDSQNYPLSAFKSFIEDLHDNGQKYVMMFDPAIEDNLAPGTYPPFDDGVKEGVFIMDAQGNIFNGSVWPGPTAFPDFFNPATQKWWETQLSNWHDQLPFDGMWIDMNEPSNFNTGDPSQSGEVKTFDAEHRVRDGAPFDPNNPPYVPGYDNPPANALGLKTVAMDAVQYPGIHYDVHNLYGYSEQNATATSLETILKKRAFTITRSTFPGSGYFGGHWLGDNNAQWFDLQMAIPGILAMNIFGIPLVGADICGFNGNSNAELCSRWMQVGAFYPFSRNHNTIKDIPQDPTAFGQQTEDISRAALLTRYTLLPYYYTQFYHAHIDGSPVARALIFEFPTADPSAVSGIDRQFLIGPAFLISPVLDKGATTVDAYFPDALWYDYYTGAALSASVPGFTTLDAPIDYIPLHVRGGHVIPTQAPATTTTAARKNPFSLIVALDKNGAAEGDLFLDDGETIGTVENNQFTLVNYNVQSESLKATVTKDGYAGAASSSLDCISVFGVSSSGTPSVELNGSPVSNVSYDASNAKLTACGLSVAMNAGFVLSWSS